MFQQTICLVVRGEEVLLGIKNTGFDGGLGIGRWNGYGGHIESGETIRRTSVRETEEESALLFLFSPASQKSNAGFLLPKNGRANRRIQKK